MMKEEQRRLEALKERLGVVASINHVQKSVDMMGQLRDCFVDRESLCLRWVTVCDEPEYLVSKAPLTEAQAAEYVKAYEAFLAAEG